MPTVYPLEGGCDCGAVRYRLETPPLFVHCCHCRWCQRETGASFALNALIEADRVTLLGAAPEIVDTPSASGRRQRIARCPNCRIAVWSNYAGSGASVRFVRVGTLDQPDRLPPDIHIFAASKQPWVVLPPGTPAVPEYYDRKQYWPAESLARREALLGKLAAGERGPRRPCNVYRAYHAHVYFGPETVEQARALVTEAGRLFKVQVGRVHEKLVGPHPCWSCQLAFSAAEFDRIVPWLDEHRGSLDVLVHGLTGDDLADHTTHAAWLGNAWPLDLCDSLFAYVGRYEIQADRVIHKLDGSWNELWTGTQQTRLIAFDNGRLIYSTPETIDPMDGQRCTYRVTFERA